MKRFAGILCLMLILSLLMGCRTPTKAVSCMELSVEVPMTYLDLSSQDYAEDLDMMYGDGHVVVAAVRNDRAELESYIEDLTLEGYGELVIEMNELDTGLIQKDGLWTFSYEADSNGDMFTYVAAVYESDTSFWTVQAYCLTAEYEKYQDTMWEVVSSAKTN